MVSHVSLKQAGYEKSLSTALTHVGAVSGVPTLVIGQFECCRKGFVALLTWESHLAGVALHMSLKVSRLGKSFVADVAVERFLTAVGEHVLGQALQLGKAFTTLTADIWPSCAMGLQVVV